MTAARKNPSWYDPPTDPDAKKTYDDLVATALADEQTRAQTGDLTRDENELALEKLRGENAENLRKAQVESEEKVFVATVDALRTATTGAIERSRDTAKYVQTAAIAAAGLYTGLLGFVFGIADSAADLPLRGAIPTVFFGLAVALSTWYIAYVPDDAGERRWPTPSSLPRENARLNLDFVVGWINGIITPRAWALRAASLYMLLAIAFLPAPFIDPQSMPDVGATVGSWLGRAPASVPAVTPMPTWPAPPVISQEKVALELYKRQLDQFEKDLKGQPQAPGKGFDLLLIIVAIGAGIAASRIAHRRPPTRTESPGAGGPNTGGQSGRGGALRLVPLWRRGPWTGL
jgi:hypothetical protein